MCECVSLALYVYVTVWCACNTRLSVACVRYKDELDDLLAAHAGKSAANFTYLDWLPILPLWETCFHLQLGWKDCQLS